MVAKTVFYQPDGTLIACICMDGWDGQIAGDVIPQIQKPYQELQRAAFILDKQDYEDHLEAWSQVLSTAEKYPNAMISLG